MSRRVRVRKLRAHVGGRPGRPVSAHEPWRVRCTTKVPVALGRGRSRGGDRGHLENSSSWYEFSRWDFTARARQPRPLAPATRSGGRDPRAAAERHGDAQLIEIATAVPINQPRGSRDPVARGLRWPASSEPVVVAQTTFQGSRARVTSSWAVLPVRRCGRGRTRGRGPRPAWRPRGCRRRGAARWRRRARRRRRGGPSGR